jgi:hypothetical protein
MALKKKLTKEEYSKLSDHIKAEYIEDGDGFRLDIDGDEDTGALKRAKDREAQLRRDAEAKLREAQEELADAANYLAWEFRAHDTSVHQALGAVVQAWAALEEVRRHG